MKNRLISVLLILLLLAGCLAVGVFGAPDEAEAEPEETVEEQIPSVEQTEPQEELPTEPSDPAEQQDPSEEPPAEPVEEPSEEPAEEPAEEPGESPSEEPAEEPGQTKDPEGAPDQEPEKDPDPTCTLTITREDAGHDQTYCYAVTDTDGITAQVFIRAGETSCVLVGLKPGETYTVTEIAAWSWRQHDSGSKTVTASVGAVSVTFEAVRSENVSSWLSGISASAKEG